MVELIYWEGQGTGVSPLHPSSVLDRDIGTCLMGAVSSASSRHRSTDDSHRNTEEPLIPYVTARIVGTCKQINCLSVSVTASDNIALNKIARHLGDSRDNRAGSALDGIKYPHSNCVITSSSKNPWWAVRLGAIYTIISVTVFTPVCCGKLTSTYFR